MIETLRREIETLAPATAPLEPDAADRARLMALALDHAQSFLGGTRIGGAPWLRCAILSFWTHLAHIDETIHVLVRAAAALQSKTGE